MVRITLALTFFSAGLSLALPQATKRQEEDSLVGQGNGQQFITGECASAADCASGCCVDQGDGTAQCKARLVTEQAGESCDFGGAAAGGEGSEDVADAAGEGDAASENGGASATEVDGEAGANSGTIEDGGGAGNGTDTDNGTIDDGGAANDTDTDAGGDAADAGGACGAVAEGDGSENVGQGNGQQFITGQCFSPADCASGCCADQGDGTAQCGAQFPTENERGQTCDFTCSAS